MNHLKMVFITCIFHIKNILYSKYLFLNYNFLINIFQEIDNKEFLNYLNNLPNVVLVERSINFLEILKSPNFILKIYRNMNTYYIIFRNKYIS